MNILYEAKAKVSGGRSGHVETDDGVINIDLAIPKSMGGAGGAKTNPEQLFACGYAACFDSALNFIAANRKIRLKGTEVHATVGIGTIEPAGFALKVKLEVLIPEIDRALAQELLEEAHKTCPYSKAIKGNVEVDVILL